MEPISKATLHMVVSLYEQLGLENKIFDPKRVLEAIERGHTWALPMILHWGPEIVPAVADEVVEIMCMYQHIEAVWDHLSSEDRSVVAASVPLWEKRVKFRGFAGNDEAKHLSVALFLINQLNRFPNFASRDLNSHVPMLDWHRPMLAAYRLIRSSGGLDNGFSVERLIEVLSAPDERRRARSERVEAMPYVGEPIEA